jgi:chaperonin cofactor prefoldin
VFEQTAILRDYVVNSNRGDMLLQCSETCTVTDERELADLERRYQFLQNECNSLQKQLADRDTKLVQLQTGE